MKLTKELIEKAKQAKAVEELQEFAKAENIELSAEEAIKAFAELHKTGELSDDELGNVAGGCGSGDVPKFEVGQTVYVRATNAAAKILENLGKKGDIFPEYKYKIEVHDTGIFTLERWEHELKSSYTGDD
ncbi:MAG: hypothetical protein PUJ72_02685 [Eubacteriales bacterium]|nr:hypothetical protein [Eubacteriales bacterium]